MVREVTTAAGWEPGEHPLLGCVVTIEAALDQATAALAAGTDPSWLDAGRQGLLLESLARIEHRVTALKLATLAAVDVPDGVASLTGARSPSDWLAHRLHLTPRRIGGQARLGHRLTTRPVLAAAMLDGAASPDHARAVLDCLDHIPADLADTETIAGAEEILTGYCRDFTPAEVSHLGRRVLELVAPEAAEEIEAEKVARAERDAWRHTKLTTKPIGEGLIRVTADVPALHASILDTVLDTIANPTHPDNLDQTADDGQRLSGPQRRGQALCTLLEGLDTRTLPQRHGTAVSITVLIDEDKLRRDLHAAGLLTTTTRVQISLGEGRRLLCTAGIWPTVLGGASVVLDAGRTRRLFDGPLRRAMEIAHPTCQAHDCTVPAAWCHGHHRTKWSNGGTTTAADGALLCGHHHRRAHDPRYETHWDTDGTATFHRRV